MDSLLDMWSIWFTGKSIADKELWGHTILFWGRIGKLMQFCGALTIILDIVGIARIRSFGESLKDALTWSNLSHELRYAVGYVTSTEAMHEASNASDRNRLDRATAEAKAFPHDRFAVIVLIVVDILVLYTLLRLFSITGLFIGLIAVVTMNLMIGLTLAAILMVCFQLTMTIFCMIIYTLLLKPIAIAIAHPSVERHIKSLSAIALTLGFHFDLLAS